MYVNKISNFKVIKYNVRTQIFYKFNFSVSLSYFKCNFKELPISPLKTIYYPVLVGATR